MGITKAVWTSDGDSFNMRMPLTKVDKERRLVSGFASLNNIDTQGDEVTPEANRAAFSRFRGNIREMHQPIAAGRMVKFEEQDYLDPDTNTLYKGVYVTAYISQGAESTWQKVLDGTLSGFSINGPLLDYEMDFSKSEKPVRIVKDYDLTELSLVDNPANQLANVLSIAKSADGTVHTTGLIADTEVENVFWCETDRVAKSSTDETASCGGCGEEMKNIGWFEQDGENRVEKIRTAVNEMLKSNGTGSEGGVEVADTNEEAVEAEAVSEVNEEETGNPGVATPPVVVVAEPAEETGDEQAANVEEVNGEQDLEKMFADLTTAISNGLRTNEEATAARVQELTKVFEEKVSELETGQRELVEKFASLSEKVERVEKSVKTVEDGTAIKKSGDLGGETEETLTKSKDSVWGGTFLSVDDL
jgi:hypothetical protein